MSHTKHHIINKNALKAKYSGYASKHRTNAEIQR